ncbi:MAG: hypothetical protein IPK42_01095 [Betaproteobacteria bacterium]|jgi:hypothetical protein|nr:hypothetical protein [Betaproteobacteria bacterium]
MTWEDLTPDERELLHLLRRVATLIGREAAGRRDPDTYIVEAVVAAARQFAPGDGYPGAYVDVMLHELRRLRLH